MGTLRLLLALSVVIAHAGPLLGLRLVGSVPAVEAFFVISGFYMAMILAERYPADRSGTALFYSNRFLRIFPLYWLVLLVTLVLFGLVLLLPGTHHNALATLFAEWSNIDLSRMILILSSNVALVGLDVGLFFPVRLLGGGVMNASDFYLVPQAWTLGIEVMVYALAPFLFRRSAWVICVLAATSLCARAIGYQWGLVDDPWDYRFAPFEIAFFSFGALAYKATPGGFRANLPVGLICALVILLLIIGFPILPDGPSLLPGFKIGQFVFLAATIVGIAPLFELTRRLRWDRAIGELSYPLYLGHLLIVDLLSGRSGPGNVFSVAGSLAFAWVLARAAAPLERFRQQRVGDKRGTGTTAAVAISAL